MMMLEIGEELNRTTTAFELGVRPCVLHFCMGLGGFIKCVLDLNPYAQDSASRKTKVVIKSY